MRVLTILPLLLASGCDYTGEWLFPTPSDHPVTDLGLFVPAEVSSLVDIETNVYRGEIGSTGSVARSGATFNFVGTGGSVCVWMDPELVFWNQSVSALSPEPAFAWPDNVFDDGDADMQAGFAVYYNGSPGQELGDFRIRYEDSLGNQIPVELNECVIQSYLSSSGGFSGRSAPEYCTLRATQPGVTYLVVIEGMATPLDDDRLGFALLVSDGTCDDVRRAAGNPADECVLTGEALDPATVELDENGVVTAGDAIEGSVEFEEVFCGATLDAEDDDLFEYCEDEWSEKACLDGEHCFCGDPTTSPLATIGD